MAMSRAAVQVVGPMAVEIAVEMAAANPSEAHKKNARPSRVFYWTYLI